MNYHYSRFFMFLLVVSSLSFVLAACGTASSASAGTSDSGGTTLAAASVTPTVPVPTTKTSCPAPGTARAAIMAPLALGRHPSIVYLVNEGTLDAPTFGTVKRYDVTTGVKTEIVKQAHTRIAEGQVSADGQWVLFVAIVSGQPRLQLVRMDGQGLQTLYCATPASAGANPASAIEHVQWSTNQRSIVFDTSSNSGTSVSLLNLTNGNLETLLAVHSGHFYSPLTWLDNTQVFLSFGLPDNYPSTLDLLDTGRGANQPESNLRTVFTDSATYPCWDFDTSYDGKQRFTSLCTYTTSSLHPGPDTRQGPGSILVQSTYGGPGQTLYQSAHYAVTTVRSVTRNTLLFLINNNRFSRGGGVDTSHNGLWKINADGSGLTRLTSDTAAVTSQLDPYTQYPWSNVSRDGRWYALSQNISTTSTLLVGSLSSGAPTAFASIAGTPLSIAGWTTM